MDTCNPSDTQLILLLWHYIQQLLAGMDPWSVMADLYTLARDCGRTVQP